MEPEVFYNLNEELIEMFQSNRQWYQPLLATRKMAPE